jgi:hypothetical protein
MKILSWPSARRVNNDVGSQPLGFPTLSKAFASDQIHQPEPAAIVVRNLWKTYPGKRQGDPIHVLERISLQVREGEFVCIVGPSGCGKTTLLNIIAGFADASRGEVIVEGEIVHGPDHRRIFIFQEGGGLPLADRTREHWLRPWPDGRTRARQGDPALCGNGGAQRLREFVSS